MGLFSRKRKEAVMLGDLEYNAMALDKGIHDLRSRFYEVRDDMGSKLFVSYITKLLNLEILKMSSLSKASTEDYRYHQGKIDSYREILSQRAYHIENEIKSAKEKKSKADHKSKRTYIRKPSTAGIAL